MATKTTPGQTVSGGRGARERLLRAAGELFYERGIHATGVAALIERAHVSPRTFYQHFATKNALVEAYLLRFESEAPIASEVQLTRADLAPAQRLLAIFDPAGTEVPTVIRGCPFHNAAVEAAGELEGVAHLVKHHKRAFRDRLVATAAEAGAPDPQNLGRQLAVIYEGANSLAASYNDAEAFADARHAAETLLNSALGHAAPAPGGDVSPGPA